MADSIIHENSDNAIEIANAVNASDFGGWFSSFEVALHDNTLIADGVGASGLDLEINAPSQTCLSAFGNDITILGSGVGFNLQNNSFGSFQIVDGANLSGHNMSALVFRTGTSNVLNSCL